MQLRGGVWVVSAFGAKGLATGWQIVQTRLLVCFDLRRSALRALRYALGLWARLMSVGSISMVSFMVHSVHIVMCVPRVGRLTHSLVVR